MQVSGQKISAAILELAAARGPQKTICPSEIARRIGGPEEERWRPLMKPVREQAVRLSGLGKIETLRAGQVVDLHHHAGIYRIRIVGT